MLDNARREKKEKNCRKKLTIYIEKNNKRGKVRINSKGYVISRLSHQEGIDARKKLTSLKGQQNCISVARGVAGRSIGKMKGWLGLFVWIRRNRRWIADPRGEDVGMGKIIYPYCVKE